MNKSPKVEDEPGDAPGWDRFEAAVDAALHSPPQHKPKAKTDAGATKAETAKRRAARNAP